MQPSSLADSKWRMQQAVVAAHCICVPIQPLRSMAGPGNNPVQVLSTLPDPHWEFLRLWTGFELPSSWTALPCYGPGLNRNSFCAMRWPQIDLEEQDLNDI
jgi:hypothetical protein